MVRGLSAVNLANSWLNVFRNTASPAIATPFTELHTADPGAAGTTAVSVGSTTRLATAWSAAAAGSMALTGNVGPWTNGGTTETITDLALFSAATVGTFYWSGSLTVSQAWVSTNTLTLTQLTLSITPIAA